MAYFVKLEKFKITEYRDDAIFKTKSLGYEWFLHGTEPDVYVIYENDITWANTGESHFGPNKPQ